MASLRRLRASVLTDQAIVPCCLPSPPQTVSVLINHTTGALEYDAHPLYGMLQARASYASYAALKQRRPFILTRQVAPI